MEYLYRFLQGGCLFTWIILLINCSNKPHLDYQITSHHITLRLNPHCNSFWAKDTISICYKKNVKEIYFYLHKNFRIISVSVGHQPLNYQQRFTEKSDLLSLQKPFFDAETACYSVQLPPTFMPHAIDIEYYGEILDSLVNSNMFQIVFNKNDINPTLQQKLMTAECWYPRQIEPCEKFQLTVLTSGFQKPIF